MMKRRMRRRRKWMARLIRWVGVKPRWSDNASKILFHGEGAAQKGFLLKLLVIQMLKAGCRGITVLKRALQWSVIA